MTPTIAAALDYHRRGWVPVRVAPRGKAPVGRAWQTRRPTPAEIGAWPAASNVGVLLGAASGGLVDVDLDCAEAIELAPYYLPSTWVFGRASKPRSHWLYLVRDLTSHQFRDGASVILELRGDTATGPGHQTVMPPSTHTSGEPIAWDPDHADGTGGPRELDAAALVTAAKRLSRATLYRRHGATLDGARHLEAAHVPARPAAPVHRIRATSDVVERARRYLAAMPAAVSGSGGHHALWRAAVALVRGFGLGEAESLALLSDDYSPRCSPPWTDRELHHKVAQAMRATVPRGYLLGAA